MFYLMFFSTNGDYLPDLFGTDLHGNRTIWVYVPDREKRNRFVCAIFIMLV